MSQHLDSYLHSFVPNLVDRVYTQYISAKEKDDEDKLKDIEQYIAKATTICNFCCREIGSLPFEEQRTRLVEIDKDLAHHLKSLSAERQTMLGIATSFSRAIVNQDSSLQLFELATRWNEWNNELEKAPKRSSPSMLSRFFSAVGLSSNDKSPTESKFDIQLKRVMKTMLTGLRHWLNECCRDINSASSILYVVNMMNIVNTPLFTSIFKPANTAEQDRLLQLYNKAQYQLSQHLESFCIEKILDNEGIVALNAKLNSLSANAKLWESIMKIAQNIDTEHDFQCQLRSDLLAFKDYSKQCRVLSTLLYSMKTKFCGCIFLDSTKANSMNEHDHNLFYQEVKSKLSIFDKIHVLQEHITIDLSTLRDSVLYHVEGQIKKIYDYLEKLLLTFPSIDIDYKKIFIWHGNFESIERCFSTAHSAAGTARRFKEDVDRMMALTLKGICPPDDIAELVPLLLSLKKASIIVSCYMPDINHTIDELILSMSSAKSNSGRFILDVRLALENVEEDNKAIALQILSEHKCFEGAMNAVFNAATARQGINYVIDSISLSDEGASALLSMYADFEEKYKNLIAKGLTSMKGTAIHYFQGLVDEARNVANDDSIDYRSQLTHITASVFAYWSLKSMNSFVADAMSNDNNSTSAIDYLKRPHAAQVVAIWLLLNFEHADYQVLENHFIEILTGEGKLLLSVIYVLDP